MSARYATVLKTENPNSADDIGNQQVDDQYVVGIPQLLVLQYDVNDI